MAFNTQDIINPPIQNPGFLDILRRILLGGTVQQQQPTIQIPGTNTKVPATAPLPLPGGGNIPIGTPPTFPQQGGFQAPGLINLLPMILAGAFGGRPGLAGFTQGQQQQQELLRRQRETELEAQRIGTISRGQEEQRKIETERLGLEKKRFALLMKQGKTEQAKEAASALVKKAIRENKDITPDEITASVKASYPDLEQSDIASVVGASYGDLQTGLEKKRLEKEDRAQKRVQLKLTTGQVVDESLAEEAGLGRIQIDPNKNVLVNTPKFLIDKYGLPAQITTEQLLRALQISVTEKVGLTRPLAAAEATGRILDKELRDKESQLAVIQAQLSNPSQLEIAAAMARKPTLPSEIRAREGILKRQIEELRRKRGITAETPVGTVGEPKLESVQIGDPVPMNLSTEIESEFIRQTKTVAAPGKRVDVNGMIVQKSTDGIWRRVQ